MENNKILFNMHIMWYESEMVVETLDSIQSAIKHSLLPVEFHICLNSQTYIEQPVTGLPQDMFKSFVDHPVLQGAKFTYKTNAEEFFGVGDWRREVYGSKYKYTIWGEPDCLLPEDFFYILSNVKIDEPHILTFSCRKMWDTTWDNVEHRDLQQYKREEGNLFQAPVPFNSCDIITQEELNGFNNMFDIEVCRLDNVKVDGSLVCLSNNINKKLIPDNLHFVREDFCAECALRVYEIPQYHVTTRIKGHNFSHNLKKVNVIQNNNKEALSFYTQQSEKAMVEFVTQLYNKNTK